MKYLVLNAHWSTLLQKFSSQYTDIFFVKVDVDKADVSLFSLYFDNVLTLKHLEGY